MGKVPAVPDTPHSLPTFTPTKTTGYRPNHERLDLLSDYTKTTTYQISSIFHLTKTTGYRPNHERLDFLWIFSARFSRLDFLDAAASCTLPTMTKQDIRNWVRGAGHSL